MSLPRVLSRGFSTSSQMDTRHFKLLIAGGGAGGVSAAARMTSKVDDIAVIEPNELHYYQPLWTLVGGGLNTFQDSVASTKSVLPSKTTWIQDSVTGFHPEENSIQLSNGDKLTYDVLLVALGIRVDFHKIKGLPDAFQNRLHKSVDVHFYTGAASMFGVPKYAVALREIVDRRGIQPHFRHDLVEVCGDKREAVFEDLTKGEKVSVPFSMIHVTPPMSAPSCLAKSSLANDVGFLDANRETLQHNRHDNVFGIGDCTHIPTSKTAAAVASQLKTVSGNISAFMDGRSVRATYKGYTACPLVTSYNTGILAEFDFNGEPMETFPFDQSKESWILFQMKKRLMKPLYFHGMLKGRWTGPATIRKMVNPLSW